MQHDTVIWGIISPKDGGFCSYRRKLPGSPAKFCKNPYNVLGLCTPTACPLANSRYATIREHKGECYLLVKTIERAHTPSKLWEKIKLSKDYMTALKEIDKHLCWWPKWYIHKCKLRLTKMHQYLIRSRKLALSVQPKLVRIWKPYEKQQKIRERKAEIAAKITNVVRDELLERLNEGVYEGIYNFPMKSYQQILKERGKKDDVNEEETEEDIDIDKNKKNEHEFIGIESDSDIEFDLSDYEKDIEELNNENEIEYEYEYENGMQGGNTGNNANGFGQSVRSMKNSKKKKKYNNNNNNVEKEEIRNVSKKIKKKLSVQQSVNLKKKKWDKKRKLVGKDWKNNNNEKKKRKKIKLSYDE